MRKRTEQEDTWERMQQQRPGQRACDQDQLAEDQQVGTMVRLGNQEAPVVGRRRR